MSGLGRSFSFGDCLYKPRLNDQLWVDTYRSRSLEPWLPTEMVNAYFRPEPVIQGNLLYVLNAAKLAVRAQQSVLKLSAKTRPLQILVNARFIL